MIRQIYAYTRKAYYYETDRMGIVHHSNYIRWMEESRVSMLEQAGYPFSEMEKQGIMVPVLSAECIYKNTVTFDDVFNVIPKIVSFNGFRVEVEYRIVNSDGSVIFAQGRTAHCFVDTDMKPVRLKHKHAGIYEAFYNLLHSEVRIKPDLGV